MIGRPPFATVPGEPNPPSTDPLALLNYALKRGVVSLVNFAGLIPPGSVGNGVLFVEAPPDVCANLAGPPEQQDAYILIHIDRATLDAMDEEARKPSLILVSPGIARP